MIMTCFRSVVQVVLFSVLTALATGCKKTTKPQLAAVATLKGTASFPMGTSVVASPLSERPIYQQTVLTEYSSITADYEMKLDIVEPQQGVYNYAPGDFIVGFAAQHHLRMHGHNLIWHQALPSWVLNFQGDTTAWENLFKTHIQSVANHFKGEVASWDVVNEALFDDGTLRNLDHKQGDGTASIWRQHLGADYIARAFIYTHQADPNALLFYNDYGQEWGGPKLDSMVVMLNNFKRRGIPISGVGMQMHIDINVDTAGISNALKRLAATGLLVHISELDISVNPGNIGNLVFTYALQQQQATLYQFIAQSYKANVPSAQRYGITTWEFSDADSWIPNFFNRPDWPLPFDKQYNKKAAYFSLLKGVGN